MWILPYNYITQASQKKKKVHSARRLRQHGPICDGIFINTIGDHFMTLKQYTEIHMCWSMKIAALGICAMIKKRNVI